jgi:RHS repeat-associated protein
MSTSNETQLQARTWLFASLPTNYLYDGIGIIEELSGDGSISGKYQGAGVDQQLATVQGGTTKYYELDGLLSTTSLTDTSAAFANNYNYDGFGNVESHTGSVLNFFQYAGRELDLETGILYYRARYFDPTAGRFITEDPTGFGSGDANLYRYVFNNPIVFIDPTGRKCACAYAISTGHFVCDGQGNSYAHPLIDTYGYSGYPPNQNDPSATSVPGNTPTTGGPIPVGLWNIGAGFTGPKGDPEFHLEPIDVVMPPGRDPNSFLIHADNNKHPGYSSNGCIVLPDRNSRKKLADCGGGPLQVIP